MDELFEKIIFHALKRHATDVHMKIDRQLDIEFRVLGKLEHYASYEIDIGHKIMNYIKYKSFINVNYKLVPQTGAFHYFIDNHIYFLRVSFLPGEHFESIVIRILNNHEKLTINELSLVKEFSGFLASICRQTSGLFLVSGATGSGKSTTLYAMLDRLIEMGGKNIVTLEDPIEMVKEHCLQIEMNEDLGINYHDSLKQILRHDPDVIMIGEIRDEKTASLAITCALTGHLVLSTIHASTALLVIKRMLNLGVSETDLEDVLIGIVSQKIKYDLKRKRVIILPEMMSRKAIMQYLHHDDFSYQTFKQSALSLIAEKKCDSYILKDELNEQ
ncbi:ATPase, T2SS/T4P/T4SS family [Sharpea azabuensis]